MSISEKEVEAALDMFMQDGWRNLVEECEEQIDLITIDSCNNAEDLFFNKGRLAVLRMFTGYEQYIRQSLEQDSDILQ